MVQNMGLVDRLLRVVVAVVIAALYFTHIITGTVAIVLGVLGVVFLATSLVGFCPLYTPLKISTKK